MSAPEYLRCLRHMADDCRPATRLGPSMLRLLSLPVSAVIYSGS